jgi:predicted MFS family arabinose efflux permease
MSAQLPLSLTLYVVAMLRHVADEIEQSGMKNPLAGYVPAWYAWFIAVCAFVVGYMVGGK